MVNDRKKWLALTSENAIDPELPICDPHHHLWDRSGFRYVLEELLEDTGSAHNIVQTVFVECRSSYRTTGPEEMNPVGETDFVRDIALQSEHIQNGKTSVAAGIVGFADLTLGSAVTPVLEAQIAAGQNRFRGIRFISAWDSSTDLRSWPVDPNLLMDSKFREGFACLNKYGLSFDAWLYHPQITQLSDLARAFPDTTIILDHIGGPLGMGPYAENYSKTIEDWKQNITELAANDNVVVKLGGLGMPLCGFNWYQQSTPPGSDILAEAMAPYYLYCIEKFGVNRCMFESNFPVDKISYSYNIMWNAFKRIVKDFSPDEKAALFYDTAAKAYKLPSVDNE